MLRIDNIDKTYGSQVLFDQASLQVQAHERIGLVGRNGSGKSTLFRMILGEVELDSGNIIIPNGYRIGHIEQHLNFTQLTLLDEGCLGLPPDDIHERYKVEKVLFGLGFKEADLSSPPESFSGGFQVRLNLAKVLVSNPNLLLLDEPTNYLDIVSIRWIVKFLRRWKHELMVISHDREFMDSVTTHTAAIHREKIRKMSGSTTKLFNQIDMDETVYEQTRQNEAKQRKQMEQFVTRFRAKATKASAAQSRIKMLEKMPEREALSTLANLKFSFQDEPVHAKRLLEASGLTFSYDPKVSLIDNVDMSISPGDRIAVIGKNGRGKSTLIKLLAGELASESGEINLHPRSLIGYFGQTNIDHLNLNLSVEEEVASSNSSLSYTAVRSICGSMMFGGDLALKKVKVLSGGERSRVMLAKIIAQPSNILLLDEPTNHLDMQSIDAMIDALAVYEGAVVLVTHNEMALRSVVNRLLVFQDEGTFWFEGGYDEFLEKVGWGDEQKEVRKKSGANPKKAIRQRRGALIAERSSKLGPLEKEIKELEERISELEAMQAATNAELESASHLQDSVKIVELSRRFKELVLEIETCFAHLEIVDKEYEVLSEEFAQQLEFIT
jgi:ATP-binding cassette subfamily F protein 3